MSQVPRLMTTENRDPATSPTGTDHPIVIAVLPSWGCGGGIERYCAWLLDAVGRDAQVISVAMLHPGQRPSFGRKVRMLARTFHSAWALRSHRQVTVLVCHPALAVATLILIRLARLRPLRVQVIFHGEDIWNLSELTRRTVRRAGARAVTVSSFSAGALSGIQPASVLAPGLSRPWFHMLVKKRLDGDDRSAEMRVLTAFRLHSAVSKGLPELILAMDDLRRRFPCRLEVAGTGCLPGELSTMVDRRPWITVIADATDEMLAQLYAEAEVFVLATRTRLTPPTSGEGFGLVLAEAQLAGTPVVAPAFGGSDDAFLAGVTGLKPADESAAALAEVLEVLAGDAALRRRLGANARSWARAAFDPDRKAAAARRLILSDGTGAPTPAFPLSLQESGAGEVAPT